MGMAGRPVAFNSNPISAMYPVAANYFAGHDGVAMRLVDSLIATLPSYPGYRLSRGTVSVTRSDCTGWQLPGRRPYCLRSAGFTQ